MQFRSKLIGISLAGSLVLASSMAQADPFRLLLETNSDVTTDEVYYVSYNNYSDVLSNSIASQGYGSINVNSNFSAGGLAYDNGQYRLLLEMNSDVTTEEVYYVTYNSWADVLSNNIADQQFGSININSNFSAGGLTFDGSQYHMLLETDSDVTTEEVYYVTYSSWADVLSNNIADQQFGSININSNFSAGGLAFDGSQYHLLLESDADLTTEEAYYVSYNSWADVLSNNIADQQFGSININDAFSAGGFTAEFTTVPEPATVSILGLGALALLKRRRNR